MSDKETEIEVKEGYSPSKPLVKPDKKDDSGFVPDKPLEEEPEPPPKKED